MDRRRANLAGTTLDGLLRRWAEGWPNRVALIDAQRGRAMTYADLDRRATAVAGGLARDGVGPGARVAYWLQDSLEVIELIYGAARAGAAWVPVNARFTLPEAVAELMHARPALLVVDGERLPLASAVVERVSSIRRVVVSGAAVPPGCLGWMDLDGPLAAPGPPVRPSATAGILYTSGTTGVPKGAVHSHRTLLAWCLAAAHAAKWTWEDRIAIPYPLFHMGGVGFVMTTLAVGATAVMTGRPLPERLARVIPDWGVTALVATPTVLRTLLASPAAEEADRAWSRLRRLTTTSAPLGTVTAGEVLGRWPWLDLTELYSATEAVFSFLPMADRDQRPRSAGRPALGMSIQIRDDAGRPLPRMVPGVVWCRGSSVFTGYLPPAPERLPDNEGWHTCRDIGYLDPDGYLYLIDRQHDLINSGGEKVSSTEVEEVLLSHPAVREAAVVGVADPIWGERVHGVVALREAPEDLATAVQEILAWCRSRLAGYKVPKTLAVREELPKNAVGKILKRELRAEAGHGD
jgi:acyl-CoA synthetase (AMP-forming)/AMP-acid ligase II